MNNLEKMENKQIRFITPDYKSLFLLPDGGHIVITYPDGEQCVRECKYLGECHLTVNGECYHICQFAEIMQRAGATCAPETEPEIVAGYHIIDRRPAGDTVIKLGHNPRAVQPWVTWQGYPDDPGNVDLGHYYDHKRDAETDLLLRTEAKRTGKPYEPFKGHESKDRGRDS